MAYLAPTIHCGRAADAPREASSKRGARHNPLPVLPRLNVSGLVFERAGGAKEKGGSAESKLVSLHLAGAGEFTHSIGYAIPLKVREI